MNKLIQFAFTFSLSFLYFSCSNSSEQKSLLQYDSTQLVTTTWKSWNLLGKVKSIKEIKLKNGELEYNNLQIFNSVGLLIIDEQYDTLDVLTLKNTYLYDSNGHRTEIINVNTKGDTMFNVIFIYSNFYSALTRKFIVDNKAIYTAKIGTNDLRLDTLESLYNKKNELTDSTYFEYEEGGRIRKQVNVFPNHNYQIYEYNNDNFIRKINSYNEYDRLVSEHKFHYDFDSHGNWTNRVKSNSLGDTLEIQSRSIIYY